jgi:hypothetical protein
VNPPLQELYLLSESDITNYLLPITYYLLPMPNVN